MPGSSAYQFAEAKSGQLEVYSATIPAVEHSGLVSIWWSAPRGSRDGQGIFIFLEAGLMRVTVGSKTMAAFGWPAVARLHVERHHDFDCDSRRETFAIAAADRDARDEIRRGARTGFEEAEGLVPTNSKWPFCSTPQPTHCPHICTLVVIQQSSSRRGLHVQLGGRRALQRSVPESLDLFKILAAVCPI